MPIRTPTDFLQIFDALPDLLAIARQQLSSCGDIYKQQNDLREEFRRHHLPFKWSMPMRHLLHCSKCSQTGPEVLYELENPTPRDAKYPIRILKVLESEIHQIRAHKMLLKEEYRLFIDNVILPQPDPLGYEDKAINRR